MLAKDKWYPVAFLQITNLLSFVHSHNGYSLSACCVPGRCRGGGGWGERVKQNRFLQHLCDSQEIPGEKDRPGS